MTALPFQFSEAPTLDLSIVIVNFNTRDITLDCLESIEVHTQDISFETLVVDNASTDDSAQAIMSSFPKTRLIENQENRGFSAANNQGIRISKGRHIVLLNSDTRLVENCFSTIVRFLDAHPEFFILSPEILDADNRPCPMRLWEDTASDAVLKILGRYDPKSEFDKMGPRETREVEVVGGSCFVVRRELFSIVGLLDENYFLYNEEDDFCRRARQAGKKVCYYPKTRLQHLLGKSTHQPEIRAKVIFETYKSNLYFFSKHYSFSWNILLRSLYGLTLIAGIFRSLWKIIAGKNPLGTEDSISLKLKLLFMKTAKLE